MRATVPGRFLSLARTLGLAAVAGGLLVASFPPNGLPVCAVLAMAPLHAALALGPRPVRLGERVLAGAVVGLWVGLAGAAWMHGTLVRFAGLSWGLAALGHLAFALYVAVPYTLAAVAWGGLRPLSPWRRAAGAGLVLAAVEALFPTAVGYRSAVGLGAAPAWIQAAEVGGVGLVTAWQTAAGALLAEATVAFTRRRRLAAGALGAALVLWLAAARGFGAWRIQAVEAALARAPAVRVGLVQPGFGAGSTGDPAAAMALLRALSDRAARAGAALVVWPESAYPFAIVQPWRPPSEGPRAPYGALPRPTILATTTYREGDPYPENRAFVVDPNAGLVASYAKANLLPFGERIPLVDPAWGEAHLPGAQHYRPGPGPGVFELSGAAGRVRLAPLICYEDTIPRYAASAARRGIDAFVNLTNDSWFGATAAPWQHQALAVFRAVEARRPMVRVVAAGPSSLVDPAGRIVARTDLSLPRGGRPAVPAVRVVDLPRLEGGGLPLGFYARYAPWVDGALAAWALWLWAAGVRRSGGLRWRRRGRGRSPGAGGETRPPGSRSGDHARPSGSVA